MGKKGCFSFSISFILLAVPGVCRPMRACAPSLLRFVALTFPHCTTDEGQVAKRTLIPPNKSRPFTSEYLHGP